VFENYNGLQISTGKGAVDTSYLRLTYNDIDTLIINYLYEDRECCSSVNGYGKIASVKYNGKVAVKIGEVYKFEKE
jgi:hypothetical protein